MDTIARDWKERAEKLEAEVADLRAKLEAAEKERDTFASVVVPLRDALHSETCALCADVFVYTAQAATEYRERIVREAVALEQRACMDACMALADFKKDPDATDAQHVSWNMGIFRCVQEIGERRGSR